MLYEHYYHPWFHWLFKRLPCIPVKQGRINAESLKESLQVLEEGKILCLFPEGGITRDSKLQRPMLGIALLALKMEVPIVPVGISGTYEAFNFYHRFPRPKQVTIRFGPPLIFKKEENPSKERLMEVTKEIMDHISRLIAKEGD
jgi:1-acyl-sn-glycerol-3-phosphate acyltransferase